MKSCIYILNHRLNVLIVHFIFCICLFFFMRNIFIFHARNIHVLVCERLLKQQCLNLLQEILIMSSTCHMQEMNSGGEHSKHCSQPPELNPIAFVFGCLFRCTGNFTKQRTTHFVTMCTYYIYLCECSWLYSLPSFFCS